MDGSRATSARTIVVLLHDFYAGGAERVAITLANAWEASGRRVTILCGCEAGPFRPRVAPGVRVVAMQPPIPQGRFSRIRLGFACVRALRQAQPDVVFAPGNFHLPVIGIAARAHYARHPVFVCKLSNRLRRPDRSWWQQGVFNASTRRWVNGLDGVVAMSPALQDEARAVLRRTAVESIWEPCIVDVTVPPKPHAASRAAPHILVVGRLVAEKNIGLALRAFAAFEHRQAATLRILGDGPLRATLERESRELGIAGQVAFIGHVADTRPYFANSDLLLSTSRYEGYPAVIIEALAAGIPVVATDSTPAVPEMLFDPTFGRIAAADPEALANTIEAVWRHRPAAQPLGHLVERHRADRCARAYLRWFDRLCASRARD